MKVLLTLDGGFSKEIFNGEKAQVKASSRPKDALINTASTKEERSLSLVVP